MIPSVQAASSPWTQTDWSGGSGQTSWSDSTKFDSSSSITTSTAGQATLTATSSWYNTSWAYRKKITLDNTASSTTLTNFPVLVSLTSSNFTFSKAQSAGQDIRFTDSDGSTLLSYEIEKWDNTNSLSSIWVKIPSLTATSYSIYMYYGNSSAADAQSATSVWNSNYVGVWHLPNGTTLTANDSTSNSNNGTVYGATAITGQMDGAASFDGTIGHYINLTSAPTTGTGSFSAFAWIKTSTNGKRNQIVQWGGDSGTANDGAWLQVDTDNKVHTDLSNIAGPKSAGTVNDGAWHLVGVVNNAGTFQIYVDGAASGLSQSMAPNLISTYHEIGGPGQGSAINQDWYFNGSIDEVRISNSAQSADWILASYKSEAGTMQTFAAEESQIQTSGSLTSSIFDTEYTAGAAWGTLTYNATTPSNTSVSVKARTSNSSSMTGATAFSSCTAITSGSDISSNSCITDSHRYIQYQLSLANTDSVSTPTFQDVSIAFSAYDTTPPSISLTALSPDTNNDNTPVLTGTATDAVGTVSNVQFQMDSTSGSWTACTADDGTFDEASEAFTCTVSSALSDGSHTMYVRSTDSNSNTTADVDAASDTFTIDTGIPTVSVTAISPDPGTDATPTVSGTATDTGGTISNVQFQVDSTSGSWSSCTASDGSFNSSSESFSCTTSALSDGSHTIYVRSVDSASNNSSNASDSFTVDTTNPVSFDLDSPGNDSYTNNERPSFKWKATSDATAGLSKYVLEIDNPSLGSNQPSGDFTIDSIPTSRMTDYETNKYIIHYENFSDSDSTNNYISVYTKSHSDWGSSENDGNLREGRVSWKVKAVDNAGNETSSSRTLFVDRNSPKVELTQINDVPFSSTNFSTTDKTPTLYGKITDSLSGGDSSQTQDENGPKIASGPKQVEIKIEKKEGLTYKLHTLYTINMDKPWYICDGKEVSDNSKQKCDKYLPFEYTPNDTLDFGTYKITLTGKDKVDNSSSETSFTLNITTLAQIITPEEKKTIEEEIKELPKEEQEKVKEELEITKPVEPSALEKAGEQISQTSKNILNTTGNFISAIFNGIGQGVKLTVDTTGKALAFVGDKTGQTLAFVGRATSNTLAALYNGTTSILAYVGQGIGNGTKAVGQGLAIAGEKIGQGISALAQGTGNLLASIGQGISNTGKAIGDGYNQLANNAPGVTKTILKGIGNGVSTTANFVASTTNTVAVATTTIAHNTASTIGNIASSIASTTTTITQNIASNATTAGKAIASATNSVIISTTTIAKNTGSAIASATQNGVSSAKKGIANLAFTVGEKTDDVSHGFGTAIIKIGYLFVPEPTKISNVTAVALSPTSVRITWETNHPANGKVNWGYDDGIYEFEDQTDKRTGKHEFVLKNLKPDTEYHYEVMSQNKNYVYDANRKFKTPAK